MRASTPCRDAAWLEDAWEFYAHVTSRLGAEAGRSHDPGVLQDPKIEAWVEGFEISELLPSYLSGVE